MEKIYIEHESTKDKDDPDYNPLSTDDWEIDPIEEADRKACLECRGRQYWTIHRKIKLRRINI